MEGGQGNNHLFNTRAVSHIFQIEDLVFADSSASENGDFTFHVFLNPPVGYAWIIYCRNLPICLKCL